MANRGLKEYLRMIKNISIIGAGYVGLASAVCFAIKGYNVLLSTHSVEKAEEINKGKAPFYEEGLESLLKKAITSGKLKVVLGRKKAVLESEISFIAVGTPSKDDGSIDLSLIEASSKEIGDALKEKNGYHLIVVRSTVIPGTTNGLVKPILEERSGKKAGIDFGLAMQPEFLRQGSAIQDTLNPDRVIIGEYDKKSGDILESLYKDFYKGQNIPILRMNTTSAEMVKYASNAFLATKISFINEIANLCEKIKGLDVNSVAEGMGLDKRIGKEFLKAGLGYGGSCFPKDVSALMAFSKQLNYELKILNAVTEVNKKQALRAVELAKKEIGTLEGKKVAILGLSFKPGTDDLREAPSLKIINALIKEGAKVIAYDPKAMNNAKHILKEKINYANSALECLKDADCCILVTEWEEFKKLKPEDFIENMKKPILIDGRRIYDQALFSKKLRYIGIGLAT